jgi:hypothetical protein
MAPQIATVLRRHLAIDRYLRNIDAELRLDFQENLHHIEFIDSGINPGKRQVFFMIKPDFRQFALRRGADPFKSARFRGDSPGA